MFGCEAPSGKVVLATRAFDAEVRSDDNIRNGLDDRLGWV